MPKVENKDLFGADLFKKQQQDAKLLIQELDKMEKKMLQIAEAQKLILGNQDNRTLKSIQQTDTAIKKLNEAEIITTKIRKKKLTLEARLVQGRKKQSQDNEVIRQQWGKGKLLWQFPAGQVKPLSTPEQAVVREIKKETNINANIISKLGERVHPDTGIKCHYFHCNYLDGELLNLDQDENLEAKWISVDLVQKYVTSDMFPGISTLINKIRREC